MTQQEQQMLQGLTDRINQTQLTDKDPQAEQFLTQALGRNPDALYILAQTVLVTQYGLEQAQKQVADLRQQLEQAQQQPQRHTSFLGGLLGQDDNRPAPPPPPPGQPQYQPVPNYPAQPSYAGQPYPQAPPQYGPPVGYATGPFGGQPGGGFLQSAMRTATGVAAGAFAFEGIESLMHGFGHGGGGYGMGGFGGGQTEVVNNYYGDEHRDGGDFSSRLSSDIEDRRGDRSAFEENAGGQDLGSVAGSDFSSDDSQGFADTSSDFDDSGSSLDMGSDDSNS
jgi:hypothetical protein